MFASEDASVVVSLGLPAVANRTNIRVPTRSAEKTGLATRLHVHIHMHVYTYRYVYIQRDKYNSFDLVETF